MRAMGAIFVLSIALGTFFGAMYDLLRILRLMRPEKKDKKTKSKASNNVSGEKTNKSKEHMSSGKIKIRIGDIVTSLGDIVFLSLCGAIFSVFVFYANDGRFRAFMAIGAIIGFFSYYFTVGRLVMLLSEKIINAVRKVVIFTVSFAFGTVKRFLIKPIKFVLSKLFSLICMPIYTFIRRLYHSLFGIFKIKLIILREKKYVKLLIKEQNMQNDYQMSS